MADMSPITLMGNLTEAPTLRKTKTGKSVTNLSVARNYPRNEDGSQRPTDFFEVVVWEHLAEHVMDLPKGARVIVVGRYQAHSWTGRDGTVHHDFRIVATDVGASARWNPVFSAHASKAKAASTEQLQLPESDDEDAEVPF